MLRPIHCLVRDQGCPLASVIMKDTDDCIEDHGRESTAHKRPRSDEGNHVEDWENGDNDKNDSSSEESDSGSDSSDSLSKSSMFGGMMSLPQGVPTWVLTNPVIPDQFSHSD